MIVRPTRIRASVNAAQFVFPRVPDVAGVEVDMGLGMDPTTDAVCLGSTGILPEVPSGIEASQEHPINDVFSIVAHLVPGTSRAGEVNAGSGCPLNVRARPQIRSPNDDVILVIAITVSLQLCLQQRLHSVPTDSNVAVAQSLAAAMAKSVTHPSVLRAFADAILAGMAILVKYLGIRETVRPGKDSQALGGGVSLAAKKECER